ncbi:DUF2911 domain-containing protein [Pontibacter sp. E15-1]|uniref:DUF2911 domain-containing protein n=1 Tax=Pontibacter sp. E15-1 TaxID=2919918 RepID=UPI001F4F3B27|nr:DUF2911 domain-containing protein [Pontibacter sp. E15-1]MCJ8165506.1 DUF2911 domain-containing protein [Pontibacter sp. E15-1]
MKHTRIFNSLAILLVFALISSGACAQNDNASKPSPPAEAKGKVGDATVTVNYSSPAVRERTIWGDLVPYGKVWRAGANEATTVTLDKDVMVEGKALPAGTYSFYTIPGEGEWTVIFNKTAKQWGTEYDEAQDALRVMATPHKSDEMHERLAYEVTDGGLVLRWEHMELPIAITATE